MARIAGVDIPRDKRVEVALTYIYGIGKTFSKQITTEAGIDPNKRTNALTDEEIAKIRDLIERNYKVEATYGRSSASTSKGSWMLAATGAPAQERIALCGDRELEQIRGQEKVRERLQ